MRAKITLHTNVPLADIERRLAENHWLADQQSPLAEEIKEEIFDNVALEHKEDTVKYFKFVVYDYRTDARGILCDDNRTVTIRLKNKDVLSLQVSTLRMVELLKSFSHEPERHVVFEQLDILEKRIRRPLLEGFILDTKKSKIAYARREKVVEFRIAKFATGIALFLIAVSFSRTLFPRDYFTHLEYGLQFEWAFDVIGKLIGSSVMTAIISFLNYRSFVKSLEDTIIRWQIPRQQETFK